MTSLPELAGYRITGLIGQGGMATVYKAVQEGLERPVALKFLSASLARDADFAKRFLREARIVGQLSHAHIVPVYDVGEQDGHYYLSMEWLSAGDLKSVMGRGLSDVEKRNILTQIAQALRYAHQRGFVHRDIKPDNILFRDAETAVVTDFGIAREISDRPEMTEITVVSSVIGSPKYMSPEQARGETLDARSDLYSLGVVVWQLLTGEVPHAGNTITEIAINRHEKPIPSLPPHLSHWQPICNRLLAYNPDDRYADCDALLRDLAALNDMPAQPSPPAQADADLTSIYDPDATMVESERTMVDTEATVAKSAGKALNKGLWIGTAIALIAAVGVTTYWANLPPAADGQLATQSLPPAAITETQPPSSKPKASATVEDAVAPSTAPKVDIQGVQDDTPPPVASPPAKDEIADIPPIATEFAAASTPADRVFVPDAEPKTSTQGSPQTISTADPVAEVDLGTTDEETAAKNRAELSTAVAANDVGTREIVSPAPAEYFAFRDAIAQQDTNAARSFRRNYPDSILSEVLRVGVLGDVEYVEDVRTRADSGDRAAQLILSELYATGWGVDKAPTQALRYAEFAAETQQPFALFHLAALILAQSPDDAPANGRVVNLLQESADDGFFLSQTLMGNLLFTNRVEGQSTPAASLFRFEQAAAQGDRNALFNLGLIYDGGLGVEQDSTRALGYFRQAAALGHRQAPDYVP